MSAGVRAGRSRQPDGVLLAPPADTGLEFVANDVRHHSAQIDPGAFSSATDNPVFIEDPVAEDVPAR